MILKPTPISSDRFTYDAGSFMFVIEASRLHGLSLGRVYDDACDVGLTLVSARSGHEIVFAVSEETRDADGDLIATILRPVRGNRNNLPLTIHILND